jgi:DnaJ-class molecular chaperone
MFKDYYQILEISQASTLSDIISAYRKQALRWHPDKNNGNDTTEKMRDIIEAKELLTDNIKRIRYDKEYIKYYAYQREKLNKKEQEEFNQQGRKEERKSNKTDKDYNKGETAKDAKKPYQFDDEILKKWMKNARIQANKNLQNIINEFSESPEVIVDGFGAFFKHAILALTIGAIFYILVQLLKTL